MEKIIVDVEEVLSGSQCHFNWGLEEYEESFSDPKLRVDDYIRQYNLLENRKLKRRFNSCLHLSYMMYRDRLDGWDKVLENGFRIVENTRDPDYPQGLNTLPSYDSLLYTGSTVDFFAYDGNLSAISVSNKEVDHNSISDECDREEKLLDDDSFIGLYVAAEHIFYTLKATFLFRIGSSSCEVLELLSHVVRMDDMTPGDKAALLAMKASTIRHCGSRGIDSALGILKAAILIDPDNLRWPLKLIVYLGEKRRLNWGQPVDKLEIQSQIQVIDSVLQHDLEPWLRESYQFNKLQALHEIHTSYKDEMSAQERASLYQRCYELNETLAGSTHLPNILAYCAQFYSSNHKIEKAVQLIENALEKKPDSVYINAKASNIYKRAGNLHKALEYAEKAATYGFGSCWQVFELKIALKHNFDYEEFFSNLYKNFPQDHHVKFTLKNAALFYMVQGDFKHALAHFKALLDAFDSDDKIYDEAYFGFNCKKVHTVEAAYNVALFVLSSDYEHDDKEETVGLCNGIKEEIEEKFDLNGFKYTGCVTPKQYVDWLRQKRAIGFRDSGPFTVDVASRTPNYHGDRAAGGERSSNYQVQGSAYQNRYSMTSEPSHYKYRFGDDRAADVRNRNHFGNRSDSSYGTAFHDRDHPPRQSYDRLSEHSGINAGSAENMANYFGSLGSSAKTSPVDCVNTRSTRHQSAGIYPGANRQNYKPSLLENWRSRSDSAGETRPSCSRKSVDSCRNWRERDNSDTQ